jgi:hypothetical protein
MERTLQAPQPADGKWKVRGQAALGCAWRGTKTHGGVATAAASKAPLSARALARPRSTSQHQLHLTDVWPDILRLMLAHL